MSQTASVILGYTVFFVYMALLMLGGELLVKKSTIDKQVIRKLQHILTSASWLIGVVFFGNSIHIVLVNFLGFILLTVATLTGALEASERKDSGRSWGLMYFGLSTLIVISIAHFFCPPLFLLTGIPYYCLALGDGFAPIAASLFKKHNKKISEHKSLAGTLCVLAVSSLVTAIFSLALDLGYSVLFIISVGALCSVLELFGYKGTDNLLIDLGVFGYIVLNYFGLVTPAVMVAVILAPPVVIAALAKRSLTPAAAAFSCVFTFLSSLFAGWSILVLIISLFVLSELVGRLAAKSKKGVSTEMVGKSDLKPKKERRGVMQIIANSIVAIAFALVYYITDDKAFLFAAYVAVVEEFADSMASDIGKLSAKNPRDILTFKRIERGVSGGVSPLGTLAALGGTVVGTLILGAFHSFALTPVIVVASVAFVGTLVDSVLGSGVQALYLCPVCQKQVENPLCCGNKPELIKGVFFINNTAVNFVSGALSALAACALLIPLI